MSVFINVNDGEEEFIVVKKKAKKLKSKLLTKKVELIIEEDKNNIAFIKQVYRKDILANMLANTNLSGKELFELIMNENNSSPSNSQRGNLYESLCEILIITKCIDTLNYTNIMIGDLSVLKQVKNIKLLLTNKIHQGGNVSDISICYNNTTICFSVKYNNKKVSMI